MLASLMTFTVEGSVLCEVTPRSLTGRPLSFRMFPSTVSSRNPKRCSKVCSGFPFWSSVVRRV